MSEEYFIPIFITLFIILFVLAFYVKAIDKIKRENRELPVFSLFIALSMYTLPIVFISVGFATNWSITLLYSYGATVSFIVVVGPIIMFLNAVGVYKKRVEETYYWWIYAASLLYIPALLLFGFIIFIILAIMG